MSTNNMIRLNVGGVMFMTSLPTLQSCPSSRLSLMFSPSAPNQLPPSGAFFLDSSPAMFGYVLDWCMYKQLVVDRDNMDWSGLEVVADFFGLEEMKQEVKRRRKQDVETERQQKREKFQKKERKREEKRDKEERHMKMMENLDKTNQLLDQIRSEQAILGLASLD